MTKQLHMKQGFVLFLIVFALCAFCPVTTIAGGSDSLTILYTGSVRGAIEPIRG